jgi:abhydrolase domain-containing protein 17
MGQGLYKQYVFYPPNPPTYDLNDFTTIESNGLTTVIAFCSASPNSAFHDWCFIYSHGNAEDLGLAYPLLKLHAETFGINVVSYDFGGYGHSTGEPSEERCYEDSLAVYEYLIETKGFKPEKIILYGKSLGSGPTVHLAKYLSRKHKPFGGVILQSPIESAIRVVSSTLSYVVVDMFQNFKKISSIKQPVCIIHGTDDEVVPFANGVALSQLVPKSYLYSFVSIEGGMHNNLEVHYWQELQNAIQNFLNHLSTIN